MSRAPVSEDGCKELAQPVARKEKGAVVLRARRQSVDRSTPAPEATSNQQPGTTNNMVDLSDSDSEGMVARAKSFQPDVDATAHKQHVSKSPSPGPVSKQLPRKATKLPRPQPPVPRNPKSMGSNQPDAASGASQNERRAPAETLRLPAVPSDPPQFLPI